MKPTNDLVDKRQSPLPWLSIINPGLSVSVINDETLIEGYRGTPSWVAPEVWDSKWTREEPMAIWQSCEQALTYLTKRLPADGTSAFGPMRALLLRSDPKKEASVVNFTQSLRYSIFQEWMRKGAAVMWVRWFYLRNGT